MSLTTLLGSGSVLLENRPKRATHTAVLPDRAWWKFDGASNPKTLATLYSVGIMALDKLEYVRLQGIDPAADSRQGAAGGFGLALYQFRTPPQAVEFVEPMATQIQPTQDGGMFIESQGSLLKDIRVSGTVGMRPKPVPVGEFGPLKVPGVLADFFLTDDRGLDPSEITGFDDLIFLRNLFRAFADMKKVPQWARKLGMVWTTMREGEAWIVEPQSFTTSRDKSAPLGWRYSIQFRTLYLLEQAFPFTSDPVSAWGMITNAWKTFNQLLSDIATSINQLTDAVNWLANLPANLIQDVLNGAYKIMAAGTSLGGALHNFGRTMSQGMVRTFATASAQLKLLLDQKYPVGTAGVTGGNTAGAVAEPWTQASVAQVRAAINAMQRAGENLLGLDVLWQLPRQVQMTDYSKAYLNDRQQAPFTAGSPLLPNNIRLPDAAIEVTISAGDDIRALAKRYLGDEAQWKRLAIINNLRFPYVSYMAGDGVLGPGSKLLIPREEVGDEATSVLANVNTDAAMEAQSQVMRKYGRDIRLAASGPAGELSDCSVSARGDLEVIEGVPNVEQACMIKLSTERGELATHPNFGARYPLGTKVDQAQLQEYAINYRQTMLSDPRIAHIVGLKFATTGNELITNSRLRLVDSNVELPISFATRS